jgi:hypothetical protein
MMLREWLRLAVGMAVVAVSSNAFSQDDPGRTDIGRVSVTVYYATNGDVKVAGKKAAAVSKATEIRLRGEERLRFTNYRVLGQDVQPLLRSYESWAQPLKPSDEVLVRFEARSRPTRETTFLDLEFWFSRKKVLKMDARLEGNRPLFVLGPEWRGGRLIIGVALAPEKVPGS